MNNKVFKEQWEKDLAKKLKMAKKLRKHNPEPDGDLQGRSNRKNPTNNTENK